MMADAGSLQCPGCGAAAEPMRALPLLPRPAGDGQLPLLLYARLRRRGLLPQVRRGESPGAERRRRGACPACRSELQRIDVGSTPLLECASCDGVWVDADVFERLCAERESQAAVLQRLATRTTEKTAAAGAATGRASGAGR